MEKIDQLIGRSIGIKPDVEDSSIKNFVVLKSLAGEIRNKENSTARKVGECAVLAFYFICALVLVEALSCLGNWMWSEYKKGVASCTRTAELKNILVNDVKTKVMKAGLPLVANIVNKLFKKPKVIETIAFVTSVATASGKAAINDVLGDKGFKKAKKSAIDSAMESFKKTQNAALKDFSNAFGIAAPSGDTETPAGKGKPTAKNPAVEMIKKLVSDEFDTMVMKSASALIDNTVNTITAAALGPSKKEPTSYTPSVTTKKAPRQEPEQKAPALEEQGKQMERWLRALIEESMSGKPKKQAPAPVKAPTTGAIPEVKKMKDKFVERLKNDVVGAILAQLLIKFDLDEDVLPKDEPSIGAHFQAIAQAAAMKKATSYLPSVSGISSAATSFFQGYR